jgi:hypothetical protein
MSTSISARSLSPTADPSASFPGNADPNDVVEISLLLPRAWATDLIELSKDRRQSVGVIVRSMIRQGLNSNDATV